MRRETSPTWVKWRSARIAICAKSARILGVGGEEPAAYGPGMRQMARYMQSYPLREFVSHRFPLRDVEAAVHKAVAADSMKVAITPWA